MPTLKSSSTLFIAPALLLAAACLPATLAARSLDPVKIHAQVLVLDGHADILIPKTAPEYATADGTAHVSLDKLERGGVDAIVLDLAVPTGPGTAEGVDSAWHIIEEKYAALEAIVASSGGKAAFAYTAADVDRLHRQRKIAIIIGFQNTYAIGGQLSKIDTLRAMGVRVFAIVHAGHTPFADSSRPVNEPDAIHNGLSNLGKAAVTKLNDLGILIDISQLTPDGVRQVLALCRVPVIATHSNARALVDNTRNLSDQELDLIAAKGGVVGVTPFSSYVRPPSADYLAKLSAVRTRFGLPVEHKQVLDGIFSLPADQQGAFAHEVIGLAEVATLKEYIDHLDYIVNRIGIDHVAIGSDFDHGSGVTGFANAADAPNITAELVKRGYSKRDIAKIWSGNFLRVLLAAQRGARTPSSNN